MRKQSFTVAELIAFAAAAKPIPIAVVPTPDWGVVWDAIQKDGHFVLACSQDESRLFYQWAGHHKKAKVSIIEIASDVWLAKMKTHIT